MEEDGGGVRAICCCCRRRNSGLGRTSSSGELMLGDPSPLRLGPHGVELLLEGTNPDKFNAQLDVEEVQLDPAFDDGTIGAAVVSLHTRAPNTGTVQWRLGRPNCSRMVALSRFKLWWMRPNHVARPSTVPPETQLLLGEIPGALPGGGTAYSLFIPLLDGGVKCMLRGASDETLHVVAETGCPSTPVPPRLSAVYTAVGADPFVLLEASMAFVRRYHTDSAVTSPLRPPPLTTSAPLNDAEDAQLNAAAAAMEVDATMTPAVTPAQGGPAAAGAVAAVAALVAPAVPGEVELVRSGSGDMSEAAEAVGPGSPLVASPSASARYGGAGETARSVTATGSSPKVHHHRGSVAHGVPAFVDTFGWCTWDSCYTLVNHSKVVAGLDSLTKAGIRVRWMVLDDGWQSVGQVDAPNGKQWRDRLTSIKANHKFQDLGATVQLAKQKYGVEHFLVWHAVQGYWQGVDADHPELAARYKAQWQHLAVPTGISEVDPEMRLVQRVSDALLRRSSYMRRRYGFGLVPPEALPDFYKEYHAYLREHGVDGVKVDAQSILSCLGTGQGGTVALTRAAQAALAASVTSNFGGPSIIHCMCHDSAMLLQLPAHYPNGERPVVRGSDDFYPRDSASHGSHLYANAFNALMLAHCGALQDWDMFQTSLGAVGHMHAAARAISGGPVYISDRPGEHDTALIRKMVLEDGSIPRARRSALPTLPSLFVDAQHDRARPLLSIWNENPARGHGVVGVFNVYGSRWDQTARAYRWVRGHEQHRLSFTYAAAAEGAVRPRDCHALLRQELVAAAAGGGGAQQQAGFDTNGAGVEVEVGGDGGDAKPSPAEQQQPSPPQHHSVYLGEPRPPAAPPRRRTSSAEHGSGGGASPPLKRPQPQFAVYLHNRLELHVAGLDEAVPTGPLGLYAFEVATVSRIRSHAFARSGRVLEWASIGLPDLFNAGGAILHEGWEAMDGGRRVCAEVHLRGSGLLLALCSLPPAQVTLQCGAASVPVSSDYVHPVEGGHPGRLNVHLPSPYEGEARILRIVWLEQALVS